MKTLPVALKAELEAQEFRQAVLVSLNVLDISFYFTTWDLPVFLDGQVYTPRGMEIHPINSSASTIVETVSLDIEDVDRGLYRTLQEQDTGIFPTTITVAVLDAQSKVIASLVVFDGTIDMWDYMPGRTSLTLAALFSQHQRMTLQRFSTSCRWRVFKGVECQFEDSEGIEATSCDRTYDRCESLQNNVNFGGFRFLASMVNKRLELK